MIDESALRKITPDLSDQPPYLLDVQRPNLRVQVLPHRLGPHAVMPGGFTILNFPSSILPARVRCAAAHALLA